MEVEIEGEIEGGVLVSSAFNIYSLFYRD